MIAQIISKYNTHLFYVIIINWHTFAQFFFLILFSQGIPRNLSESQLLQIGSKALSNVAGQFSKLGQTLNPAKIRSAKKSSNPNSSQLGNDNSDNNHGIIDSPTKKTSFTVGKAGRSADGGEESMSDSDDDIENTIFEPDVTDLVQENPIYNENVFLPSVGIVMAPNDSNRQIAINSDSNNYVAKMSADVCTMSISSITDHIIMPAGMLENASPIRARSPAPEIRVQDICIDDSANNLAKSSGHHFSHSSGEMNVAAPSGSTDIR